MDRPTRRSPERLTMLYAMREEAIRKGNSRTAALITRKLKAAFTLPRAQTLTHLRRLLP